MTDLRSKNFFLKGDWGQNSPCVLVAMHFDVMYLLEGLLILRSTTDFLSVCLGIRMVMQEDCFRS